MNIGAYKLTTGELIIGRVKESVEPEEKFIVIEKPFTIHIIPADNSSYRLALMPYNPINPEGEERIYKSAVVSSPVSLPKEIVDGYVQQSSGIEIATNLEGVK